MRGTVSRFTSGKRPRAASTDVEPSPARTVVDSQAQVPAPVAAVADEAAAAGARAGGGASPLPAPGPPPPSASAEGNDVLSLEDVRHAVASLAQQGIVIGIDAVSALVGSGAMSKEKDAQLADARLPADAEALYHSACRRGAVAFLVLSVDAVRHEHNNPRTIPACPGATGAGRNYDFSNATMHNNRVRFACYQVIRNRLNYACTPRIPWLHISRPFCKLCDKAGEFPSPDSSVPDTANAPAAATSARPVHYMYRTLMMSERARFKFE